VAVNVNLWQMKQAKALRPPAAVDALKRLQTGMPHGQS
jgi:hypothetical protein